MLSLAFVNPYILTEKHYQKSPSVSSEKNQNIEIKEIFQNRMLNNLMNVENSNDYVVNKFKQQKKKRLRKESNKKITLYNSYLNVMKFKENNNEVIK